MKRIVIVGISGAGKSTLAKRLAEKLGLPLHHVDAIFHLPGWVARPKEVVRAECDALAAQEAWVAEGMFKGVTKGLRDRAELIVFLDFHPLFCALQVVKRFLLHKLHLSRRFDLAEGFDEKISWEFIWWILTWRRHTRPDWLVENALYGDKVVVLTNRAAVRAWLKKVA